MYTVFNYLSNLVSHEPVLLSVQDHVRNVLDNINTYIYINVLHTKHILSTSSLFPCMVLGESKTQFAGLHFPQNQGHCVKEIIYFCTDF